MAETVELRAVRLTLALSPVPQEVDIVLAERSYRLRPVTLWGALLDAQGAFSWRTRFRCGPG